MRQMRHCERMVNQLFRAWRAASFAFNEQEPSMIRPLATALLVFPVLAASCTGLAAQSQPACGPRDVVVERLATAYGETRRSIGLGSNSHIVEVFASTSTGTWTITVTSPSGITCLAASGHAYEAVDEPLPSCDGV
jgi:hypothetical protein